MFRPVLHRTPSLEIINRLCTDLEGSTSSVPTNAQQSLDAYLQTTDEPALLARGQRLAQLTVGLQAPHAQHRAKVADRIAERLKISSERFALAWQWGLQCDPQPIVDAAVNATTQMAKSLADNVDIDAEATRKTCEEAIANNAYNLRLALGRAEALSAPVLGALVGEYRPLMADSEARIQAFSKASLTALTEAVMAAENDEDLEQPHNMVEMLATLENVRQFIDGGIGDRFANVIPTDEDSESIAALKTHMLVRMLQAAHGTFKDTDFEARRAFYATAVGRQYQAKAPALQQLAQSILSAPIEEASKAVSEAAVRALAEQREQQQAFFQQLQDSLYQSFLDSLPEDPAIRAEAIRTFEETVATVTGRPFERRDHAPDEGHGR